MFDMHNDLLTIAYCSYLNNNYDPLKNFYRIICKSNIKGIVANLYFMSKEEMTKELGPNYYLDDVPITDMFKKAKEVLTEYMPDIFFKYSIEGCDYLKITDLKLLKELGLNAILPVWNNPNQYGSGIRSDKGLTERGKKFIKEAMRLNLYIDVSHANEKTFNDIMDIVRSDNYPLVYASHSNIRNLFDHGRNLYDYQLKRLKEVNGKLGLVAIHNFTKDITEYIEHIKVAVQQLGIDKVMIATDNMDFIGEEFKGMSLVPYQELCYYLKEHLKIYYNEREIDKILYQNSIELFKREG